MLGDNEIQKAIKVYNSLCDEVSKQIFLYRLAYEITGEKRYLEKIVRECTSDVLRAVGPADMDNGVSLFVQHCMSLDSDFVIYGIGHMGNLVLEELESRGLSHIKLCDRKANTQGLKEYKGFQVLTPEELVDQYKDHYVVIATTDFYNEVAGWLIHKGWDRNKLIFIHHNTNIICGDSDQYFPKDIIIPEQSEVFVDCGCYNGDTTLKFINWCNGDYEKVIALEPDKTNYELCKSALNDIRDVNLVNLGAWDKPDSLHFSMNAGGSAITETGDEIVHTDTIDHLLGGGRATFIKMDIEGAEANAIMGARETICRYKPKLAICVYHRKDDLIRIPSLLQELVPEYHFYIRHHTNLVVETVLYAI